MKRILAVVLVLSFSVSTARAEPSREFLMSCIYGTLAGTIIGAASLATADEPSEKLQRIARGASLGLYAGILLGLYVVYAVPDEDDQLNDVLSNNTNMKPFVYPILNDDMKLEGGGLHMTVLNF